MLGCLTRAKFQVRHIFSIKINMRTVQQYGVGEGGGFSFFRSLIPMLPQYIAGVVFIPYAENPPQRI